jgi:hypothetical protein
MGISMAKAPVEKRKMKMEEGISARMNTAGLQIWAQWTGAKMDEGSKNQTVE